MPNKVWLLAGIVATFGFGAAEAQAGTVFKACMKDPLSTFIGECGNVFIADAGQENDVAFTLEYVGGAFYETFSEPGQVIRPPLGARDYYFGRQGAVGQPVLHETLLGCRFAGFDATCDWEYDNCCGTPFDQSLIYLGDGDDTLLVRDNEVTAPNVYAEEGDDTIRDQVGGRIDCGPGNDTVFTRNTGNVAGDCETVIQIG